MERRVAESVEASDPAAAPSRDVLPADPREDLLFLAFTAAVMAVFLYFNVLNVLEERSRGGHAVAFWEPAVWEASSGLVFLGLTPLIQWVARHAWPIRGPWPRKIAIHLAAAVTASLAHVLLAGPLRWAAYVVAGGHYDPLGPLGDWPYELRKDLFVYVAIVGNYVIWRQLRGPRAVPSQAEPEVLEVRDGARRHFVPLDDVVWVEAAGNYVELHRGDAGLLHRASLSEMERRLQGAGFVRIHRSRLVRREAVAAVESRPSGDFLVRLRDGRELNGSRRYRRPLLTD